MSTPTEGDSLIRTAQVRARYGNVSHMWVHRRLKDDPTFPRPIYIARLRFWRLGDLIEWERALPNRRQLNEARARSDADDAMAIGESAIGE